MDVTQALKDAENALRDFIAQVLARKLGSDWVEQCGVSEERVEKWRARRVEEVKRQRGGVVEERLIYYADFYDLTTILKKHWQGEFSEALGDLKTTEVLLKQLENLRDPDAHRRELMPHQKHLAIGISGEIRNRLTRYRSKMETEDDCFPRIESARDSLGHIWIPGEDGIDMVDTGATLRPGDVIEFVVTASDPLGGVLEYAMETRTVRRPEWQRENHFSLRITEEHIGRTCMVTLHVRSDRPYHAGIFADAKVYFSYKVLPRATPPTAG